MDLLTEDFNISSEKVEQISKRQVYDKGRIKGNISTISDDTEKLVLSIISFTMAL